MANEKHTGREASLAGPRSLERLREICPEFARAEAQAIAAREHREKVAAEVERLREVTT